MGVCFLNKNDYDSAIKLFKPLANKGNVEAQNWLESCFSLREAYDTDENRLKNLMDRWKEKAIDSTKLEQILVQHKQYIFNEVYRSGTANSLKFISNKGDVIEVSINWTDLVTQGNSIIGIDYTFHIQIRIGLLLGGDRDFSIFMPQASARRSAVSKRMYLFYAIPNTV